MNGCGPGLAVVPVKLNECQPSPGEIAVDARATPAASAAAAAAVRMSVTSLRTKPSVRVGSIASDRRALQGRRQQARRRLAQIGEAPLADSAEDGTVMRRRVVLAAALGVVLATVAAPSTGAASPTCTAAQKAQRQAAVVTYRKGMARARA